MNPNDKKQTERLANAMNKTAHFGDQFAELTPYNFQADAFLGINFKNLFKSKKQKQEEAEQSEVAEPTLKRDVWNLDEMGLGKKIYKPTPKTTLTMPKDFQKKRKEVKEWNDTVGGKILNTIGELLTGESGGSILSTPENPINLPEVTVSAKRRTDKNAQTIFYVMLGVLLVVMLVILIKKSKK